MARQNWLAVVLSVFLGVLAAASESSAYTQSYVTYWRTTPVGGGNYEYRYWVLNTGGQQTSYWCTDALTCGSPPPAGSYDSIYNVRQVSAGPPQVIEFYSYSRTPVIWDYEVPILTQAAYDSIVPGSIFQPSNWSYEFLDPAGIWTNTTGDPAFDNPYRILHWKTDTNPLQPNWADPGGPPDPGTDCWYSYEMCADPFGYVSVFSALLGPDQTSWTLQVYENLSTWTVPISVRRGDPDLMNYQSNGGGAGGGIPLAFFAPQQGAPIPEPSTVLLLGAGLVGLALWGRKKMTGRS